jgi:hypothetical protein
MGERLASNNMEFDQKEEDALYAIGSHALDLAALRYGSSFPEFVPGMRMSLGLNTFKHGFAVGEYSALMAEAQDLSPSMQEFSRTIGNAHDVVNDQERGKDERESAAWLEARLAEAGFDRKARRIGSRAILGTQPVFLGGDTKGKIIGQMAAHMEFDSEEEEKVVKGVACADFGELFTPSSPLLGHYLLKQREGLDPRDKVDMKTAAAFQAKEGDFLAGYHYLLPEAEKLLTTHRREVIEYAYFLNRAMERGDVSEWSQVEALDLAFQKDPSLAPQELLRVA